MLAQQVLNGVMIGSVYALTAMGATLIYGILHILDIANAAAYVIGAYIGWLIYYQTGSLVLAFVLSMLITGSIGVCIHRFIYAPILAKPRLMPIVPLVCSVGLFTMSGDLIRLIAGPSSKAYNVNFGVQVINIGILTVMPAWILILILTVVLFFIMWFVLNKTKMGLAWRATAEDPEIAQSMGVNTNSAMALSYVLGYGFAASAGIMVGILYNSITPALGEVPSYKMLAIIVLGGLGNPVGTVAAGLFIGLAETMISAFSLDFLPKDSIAFIVLIVVLLLKPSGLISEKSAVRIEEGGL